MKDASTRRWYHHLLHARVLLTIAFTAAIWLFFAAFGLYILFFAK